MDDVDSRIAELLEEKRCAIARESMLGFMERTSEAWVPGRMHKEICRQLDRVVNGEIDRLMFLCPPQHGKQLSHSTPMLTPNGWTTHGDLRVGDEVFGSDGNPTRVVALSDDSMATYEVAFTDGESVRCHASHEWLVYDRKNARFKPKVVETRWLISEGLWEGERGKRRSRMRFAVDWLPIVGVEQSLPCEPYSFGAWLGDGSTGKPCITHSASDEAVALAVGAHYPLSATWIHKTTGVHTSSFAAGGKSFFPSLMTMALRATGAMNEKHIPGIYLSASVEQRSKLLAGLMDTDGCIHHPSRRASFSTSSKRLADDVASLVRTFGVRATTARYEPVMSSSGIQGRKPCYQVTFSPTMAIPCELGRKRVSGFNTRYRKRGISDISPCEPELGRCIEVANKDGIYLAGRGLIPTHNSSVASRRFPAYLLGRDPKLDIISVSASSTLAEDFGRDVRNCISDPEYPFHGVVLSEDSQARGKWHTKQGGSYYAVGVGGQLYGKGGLGIIDDAFGSWDDAMATGNRDFVWDWYRGTFYNRIRPGQPIIVIQHRMHDDDLAGRLLEMQKSGGDKWEVVNFPADLDDPPWPERYDRKALERIRDNTDPRQWSALYLQKPTPDDGTFFKREWFKFYKTPPEGMNKYLSSDFGVTEGGDATEIGIHGVDSKGDLYLCVDGWGGKTAPDVWIDEYLTLVARHKTLCEFNEAGVIRRSIEGFLKKRRMERRISGRVEWVAPIKDKVTRARSLQGMAAMGRVWIPDNPYGHRVLNDLLRFPGSREDHTVDMCSLIGMAVDQAWPSVMKAPEVVRAKDRWQIEGEDDDDESTSWKCA